MVEAVNRREPSEADLLREELTKKNTIILKLQTDINNYQVDLDAKTDRIIELENWISLISSMNQKDEDVIMKINEHLSEIDKVRHNYSELKKKLLHMQTKYNESKQSHEDLRREMFDQQQEMQTSEKGALVIEKYNLQNTVSKLSKEIDFLSTKNQRLLDDAKKKDFYNAYEEVSEEVVRLRDVQAQLMDMLANGEKFSSGVKQRPPAFFNDKFKLSQISLSCGGGGYSRSKQKDDYEVENYKGHHGKLIGGKPTVATTTTTNTLR